MDLRLDQTPDGIVVTGRASVKEIANLTSFNDRQQFVGDLANKVVHEIVKHVAEQFLDDHLQEVLAAINPHAVANLALAQIAAKLVERLEQKG